jgi:hypothetical protein
MWYCVKWAAGRRCSLKICSEEQRDGMNRIRRALRFAWFSRVAGPNGPSNEAESNQIRPNQTCRISVPGSESEVKPNQAGWWRFDGKHDNPKQHAYVKLNGAAKIDLAGPRLDGPGRRRSVEYGSVKPSQSQSNHERRIDPNKANHK